MSQSRSWRKSCRSGTAPVAVDGTVAAIVLAAGRSSRMGDDNKLLMPVDGKPMIAHAVHAALASNADPVIVVTGHDAEAITAALGQCNAQIVHAADHAEGMSRSLIRGIDAVPAAASGVVVCLSDMPRIRADHIDRLIQAHEPGAICVAGVQGRRGNPVLLDRNYFDEVRQIAGDKGARDLIRRHEANVREVAMDDAAALLDIDEKGDFEKL